MFNLFFTINLNKPEPLEFRKCDAKIMNNFFDTEELNKEPQKKVNSNLQLELKNYYNSQGLDLNIDIIDLHRKSQSGDIEAMFDFGNILWEPIELGGISNDYEELSIYWMKKAASFNQPMALSMIGSFMFTGNSKYIPKDPKKGEILIEKSIELFSDNEMLQRQVKDLLELRKSECEDYSSEKKDILGKRASDSLNETLETYLHKPDTDDDISDDMLEKMYSDFKIRVEKGEKLSESENKIYGELLKNRALEAFLSMDSSTQKLAKDIYFPDKENINTKSEPTDFEMYDALIKKSDTSGEGARLIKLLIVITVILIFIGLFQ